MISARPVEISSLSKQMTTLLTHYFLFFYSYSSSSEQKLSFERLSSKILYVLELNHFGLPVFTRKFKRLVLFADSTAFVGELNGFLFGLDFDLSDLDLDRFSEFREF